MKQAKSRDQSRALALLKMLLISLLMTWLLIELYPILFLFMTSFKGDPQILNAPFALPAPFKPENYVSVWLGQRASQPFAIFFRNSAVVTGGTLLLLLTVSSLAGYALARGSFPGTMAIQQIFPLRLAVPVHVLLIPLYFFMQRMGLLNNLLGVIMVYTALGLPFTIVLMRAYFLSFPRDLEEAAAIDGCSRLGTLWRVVLPISKGALASMAIINITWVWSELFFALVLLNRMQVRTLPLVIAAYRPATMASDAVIGEQFAAMAMTTLPLIIYYFIFQRQITKGWTTGAFR